MLFAQMQFLRLAAGQFGDVERRRFVALLAFHSVGISSHRTGRHRLGRRWRGDRLARRTAVQAKQTLTTQLYTDRPGDSNSGLPTVKAAEPATPASASTGEFSLARVARRGLSVGHRRRVLSYMHRRRSPRRRVAAAAPSRG